MSTNDSTSTSNNINDGMGAGPRTVQNSGGIGGGEPPRPSDAWATIWTRAYTDPVALELEREANLWRTIDAAKEAKEAAKRAARG
ncbi:hypothetical protein IFR05_012805 [Cadophora sp. M221]|nr:hypothetical protein IFR05_012805 [Cadophora sp. M221]